MKCPVCWSEKAYRREVKSWKARMLAACRIVVPMKCHHCYRLYHIPWLLTLGQQTRQPTERPTAQTHLRLSYAAESLENGHRHKSVSDVRPSAAKPRRMAA